MTQRGLALFVSTLSLASFSSGCGKESTSTPTRATPRTDQLMPAEAPAGAYGQATPSQQAAAATPPTAGASAAPTTNPWGSDNNSGQNAPAPTDSANASPLTDAQIAGITEAANSSEVDQAKLARAKAKKKRTKEFADLMISHHQAAEQAQAKLGIRVADSPIGTKLDTAAASAMSRLMAASSSDFDRTYIDVQVDAHRDLLSLIDKQLLRCVKDSGLRAYLEQMKVKVEMHLKKAEDTQLELDDSLASSSMQGTHPDSPASHTGASAAR